MDVHTKAMSLELSLLLIIIVGRWLLPKGVTSRSNLSQLLLVYMSIASDIVDLLAIFNEDHVLTSQRMLLATLLVLSWSLLQFATNVSAAGRSVRPLHLDHLRHAIKKPRRAVFLLYPMQRLFENDAWYLYELNLMSCSATQLALRLVAVIKFDVRSFSTLFFTCKNGIILFLQFYRLVAILTEHDSYDVGSVYQATSNSDQPAPSITSGYKTKNEYSSRLSTQEDISSAI